MRKRILVMVLALCMVVALLPMTALADGTSYWTDEGNYETDWYTENADGGSLEDPYVITNARDLAGLAVLVNGMNDETATNFADKHIALAGDIDLSGHDWTPIGGSDTPFGGIFDGSGYCVEGLVSYLFESYYVGLFGYIANASIADLTIAGCDMGGYEYVGSLAGYAYEATITDCHASGTVKGYDTIGGLIGYTTFISSPGMVENCSFTGTVKGDSAGSFCAGGLIGFHKGIIENSYALADVSSYALAGGLAGSHDGMMLNCYATGDVTAISGRYAGGLVGENDYLIASSFATGDVTGGNIAGGLVGANDDSDHSVIADCYATGNVFAEYESGGLAGYNDGTICTSYATGNVTSLEDEAGGISGNNYGTIEDSIALSGRVTGYYAGEVTAYNDDLATLDNNRFLESMTVIGETEGYETASVTAAESVDPDTYSTDLEWDVFADPGNLEGTWYCHEGLYPRLSLVEAVPVFISGRGFEVFGDGMQIESGDMVYTGTEMELQATNPGFAVTSFEVDYDDETMTVLGSPFILQGAATIKNVALEDMTDSLDGDIWVCMDYYVVWDSEDLNESGDIDAGDFFDAFPSPGDFYAAAQPVDQADPLTSGGAPINKNLYVLDETDLYFGDLNLGSGRVCSLSEGYINIEGGTLRASKMDVDDTLWIDTAAEVIVIGDITAQKGMYSYGCCLEVGGDIKAPSVYFDCDYGPLFVTVQGNIDSGEYGQLGGSVTVYGDILANGEVLSEWNSYADVEVGNDYADYNITELWVGGDIKVTRPFGDIFLGLEVYGSYNLSLYESSNKMPAIKESHPGSAADDEGETVESLELDPDLTTDVFVHVSGDMEAPQEITIEGSTVDVDGAMRTLNDQEARTIYIYSGTVDAGSIESATSIEIGIGQELYDLGYDPIDEVELHVSGNMTAANAIKIYGGTVNIDGMMETWSQDVPETIYIYGGMVTAGDIESVTDIYIGDIFDGYGTNDEISVRVSGGLNAVGGLYIYGGMVLASEMSFSECMVEDAATLLDAENESDESAGVPLNGMGTELYRTTLSGLIPNTMVDITILNTAYPGDPGSKSFDAVADENGCINVWLLGGETDASAHYGTVSPEPTVEFTSLTAEGTTIGTESAALEFSPPDGTQIASIGISVPDGVFNFSGLPWPELPFDPAEWTFTSGDVELEGFSTVLDAYSGLVLRNDGFYEREGFQAGDYTIYVFTEQIINDVSYIAAGSAEFTIEPAFITGKADNKIVTVNSNMPELTLAANDIAGVLEDEREDYLSLLYADCFGTTTQTGSYPIYARIDSTNPLYEAYLQDLKLYKNSFKFILQNGVLKVKSATTSSSSGSLTVYYDITATAGVGGSISPSGSVSVTGGSDKTFTVTPDSGYKIADVLVNGESVGAVSSYTLNNVSKDYTIEAKFSLVNSTFTDIPENAWYYDAVNFVLQRGLFEGTTDTTFEPESPVTRAMFVTILGRLNQVDQAAYPGSSFNDVPTGQWYSAYVEWAAQNGIVKGYSGNQFLPNTEITREELCAMLARYCEYAGIELPQLVGAANFADNDQIGDWAKAYVNAAQVAKLVQGMENNLFNPSENASRAQVAAILMRLILNVIEA